MVRNDCACSAASRASVQRHGATRLKSGGPVVRRKPGSPWSWQIGQTPAQATRIRLATRGQLVAVFCQPRLCAVPSCFCPSNLHEFHRNFTILIMHKHPERICEPKYLTTVCSHVFGPPLRVLRECAHRFSACALRHNACRGFVILGQCRGCAARRPAPQRASAPGYAARSASSACWPSPPPGMRPPIQSAGKWRSASRSSSAIMGVNMPMFCSYSTKTVGRSA